MKLRPANTYPIAFLAVLCALFLTWRHTIAAQDQKNNSRMPTIEEYQPKSTLATKEHKIDRAKFPFIDIHSHHWNPTAEEVDRLVKEMDTINLRVMVNLSGGTGEQLKQTVA